MTHITGDAGIETSFASGFHFLMGMVMPLLPSEWNVIVLGGWNPSILTPTGIITRLFQLTEETEVGVEVPMNVRGPLKISHGGLEVMVSSTALVVLPQVADYESLGRAKEIAIRAMTDLPVTPFSAAGFNVRFQGNEEDGRLAPIVVTLENPIDRRIQGSGYTISRWNVLRNLGWQNGTIQLGIARESTGQLHVQLNFERKGTAEEMINWMQRSIEQIREQVERVLFDVLQLDRSVLS